MERVTDLPALIAQLRNTPDHEPIWPCVQQLFTAFASTLSQPDLQHNDLQLLIKALNTLSLAFQRIALIPTDVTTASLAPLHQATVGHDIWLETLYPFIGNCCFCVEWHKSILQADTEPPTHHIQFQAATRDLIRDGLVPLVFKALQLCALPTHDNVPRLPAALIISYFFRLGINCAEVIGYRDDCVQIHACPQIRNYGILNVCWVGVSKIYTQGLPPSQRPLVLTFPRSSPDFLILQLVGYLEKDLGMVCMRLEAADVKLLQFWLVHISKFLVLFCSQEAEVPVTKKTHAWQRLLDWVIHGKHKSNGLLNSTMAENNDIRRIEAAQQVIKAVDEGQLWQRATKILSTFLALSTVGKDDAELSASLVEVLIGKLKSSENDICGHILHTAVALLAQQVQDTETAVDAAIALFPVIQQVLECLPTAKYSKAVETEEMCMEIADGITAYLVRLCLLSSTTAAAMDVWQESQMFLLQQVLKPHPVNEAILSRIYTSLVQVGDSRFVKSLISALYDLVSSVASTIAAADDFGPCSPLLRQLENILGSVLSVAPIDIINAFCKRYLEVVDAESFNDRCYLAAVTSLFRSVVSILTESLRQECLIGPIHQLGQHLEHVLQRFCNNGQLEIWHTAWSLEATAAGLDCLQGSSTSMAIYESAVKSVVSLLTHPSTQQEPPPAYAPAALHVILVAVTHCPESLKDSHLDALLPIFTVLVGTPETSAIIAKLAPTYQYRPFPPAELFKVLLVLNPSDALVFLGRECYCNYASSCEDSNVLNVLPKEMMTNRGRKMLREEWKDVLERHLVRKPQQTQNIDVEQEQKWNIELEKVATRIPDQLAQRAVKSSQRRVEIDAPPAQGGGGTKRPLPASAGDDGLIRNQAVIAVSDAVKEMEKVWMHASEPILMTEAQRAALRHARDVLDSILCKD